MKLSTSYPFPRSNSAESSLIYNRLFDEWCEKFSKLLILFSILTIYASQLNAQSSDNIPAAVLEFYGESASSSQINKLAPPETQEFGQLAGIWYCTGFAKDPLGKVDKVPSKAYWAWKYILDGYAVQDYFYQGKDEFLYWDYFKRGTSLTQLRVFDTNESEWKIAFITDSGGKIPGKSFGTFTAEMQEGELIMLPPDQQGKTKSRIVFYDISEDSFEWKSEKSDDNGKTWIIVMSLSGKRMK